MCGLPGTTYSLFWRHGTTRSRQFGLEPEIRLTKLTLGIATSKVIDASNPRRRNIEGHCRQLP